MKAEKFLANFLAKRLGFPADKSMILARRIAQKTIVRAICEGRGLNTAGRKSYVN